MFRLGPLELTIILVIVILLFGVGRVGKLGEELSKGIRAFREGLKSKDANAENNLTDESSVNEEK